MQAAKASAPLPCADAAGAGAPLCPAVEPSSATPPPFEPPQPLTTETRTTATAAARPIGAVTLVTPASSLRRMTARGAGDENSLKARCRCPRLVAFGRDCGRER